MPFDGELTVGREEVLEAHPLLAHLEGCGVVLRGSGNERVTNRCALNEHKKTHLCVSVNPDKQIWRCHDCDIGGSVIDWIAISQNRNPLEVYRELAVAMSGQVKGNGHSKPPPSPPPPSTPPAQAKLVKTYDYTDENGNLRYQVCRYEPKTFRQRQPDGNGGWKWTMEGATRTLYRLPEVLRSSLVICAEGEKDCDTLADLGLVATCNVGGAEKWLDAYADLLKGKDVIVIPDNDEKGKKHGKQIADSLNDKANSVKVVSMPSPHKDATDFVTSIGDKEKARKALVEMFECAPHAMEPLPLYTIEEMEARYRKFHKQSAKFSLSLSGFLPALGRMLRPMLPGELVVLMASTGVGKTAVAQAIAKSCNPLPTLFFEMEVPTELMFERFAQMEENCRGDEVEAFYKSKDTSLASAFTGLKHIIVCDKSGLTPAKLEKLIERSALKFGAAPKVVVVDYIGLMRADGGGSRYEAMSDCAEQLRIIAKRTQTIFIVTAQISRPDKKKEGIEVGLFDAKDSGSIENSGSLVLGLWRPEHDKLTIKILKNTKGRSGGVVECKFDGALMKIEELPPVGEEDMPETKNLL